MPSTRGRAMLGKDLSGVQANSIWEAVSRNLYLSRVGI
jgi:hypothetical protein